MDEDDGLGNSTQEMTEIDILIEKENAVNALVRMAKLYPKKITIMALGPLTNLALAHLMDYQFFDNISKIVLMGGNITALGNIESTAEFNFFNDPEAAHIVLTKSKCPLTIIPLETCLKHQINWVLNKLIIFGFNVLNNYRIFMKNF